MDIPDRLRELLPAQQGLVSVEQLLALGLSRSTIRRRLQRAWRMPLPGVVATFDGALTPEQRLVAAQLYAGPGAVLSSWTAARWHGVTCADFPTVRVVVPEHRSARRAGFVIVTRTTRPDAYAISRPPLLIASPTRAVADAAREVRGVDAARRLMIEAVQKQLVAPAGLRHELACGPRRGSRQLRLALPAAESGAWSMPEADLVELVAGSAVLPEAWPNPILRTTDGGPLPTPDLWFDDVGLAVQIHSKTYHARDADWDATVMNDSELGEHAIIVLGVTPAALSRDPAAILQRIERTYLSLLGRPRPAVVARRRHGH